MTAKYDRFMAALEALCAEHGVRIHDTGDYGSYPSVRDAEEGLPTVDVHALADYTEPTPEERERMGAQWAEEQSKRSAEMAERTRLHQEYMASAEYLAAAARIAEEAKKERDQQMRISTDPNDPSFIDDRLRRVTVNDVEVQDWILADEFRRVVILKSGKVLNGTVGIERLVEEQDSHMSGTKWANRFPVDTSLWPKEPQLPHIDTGFSGMFVVEPKPTAAPTPAPTPAPAHPKHKRRR